MSFNDLGRNFRAPRVDVHDFAMVPKAGVPRSSFRMQHNHKTTIGCSELYPVYLQEVLPGDSFNVNMTAFCRLSTPLFPLMDNLQLESFFFFVPNRLVWTHWYKFCGEQDNPGDSISFSIPQVQSAVNGFPPLSIYDYFGLPTSNQTGVGNQISVSALPFRCYNLIYNQWFRDENLQNSVPFGSTSGVGPGGSAVMDDGPDPVANYGLLSVCRRHDYFTSCLPWTQKGGVVVTPLGGQATVKTNATNLFTGSQPGMNLLTVTGTAPTTGLPLTASTASGNPMAVGTTLSPGIGASLYPSNLYADLSTATATTINALRLAFQTQKLLERDARGGTRYTEILRSHFGVFPAGGDARVQRPEYLGGGRSPVNVTPVPQTTATGLTGGTTPLGALAAVGTAVARHGFRQSFTEHGHILGLIVVRGDYAYQQGIRRLWKRSTRYDFYWPVFQALGEQPVFNYEIFSDGSANDALTFGFNERWSDYRYMPSMCTSYFNSKNATPLDAWHCGNKFAALPALNASFIADPLRTTIQRNLAIGVSTPDQQFLADFFFDQKVARPMPMYSVPGMIDHF